MPPVLQPEAPTEGEAVTVTTVTTYSTKTHPTLWDAERWAELYFDATGEVPQFVGHTVRKFPDGRIVATPQNGDTP